ncbi:MAG: hypothetical protein LC676_10640 [Loktanella sp.]|nr:hypothetical protein [Loktanella sp.]
MSNPTFGISIARTDGEPRPAVWSDMSVVGIVGIAEDADAATFPLDTPVFMYSDDAAMLTDLGATGTIAEAIRLINSQLGEFQVAAKVVVVRVEEGADTDGTMSNIVGVQANGTGLHALVEAGPLLGAVPRLICTPGFTGQEPSGGGSNPVVAALPAICERLLAHAVVDGPGTDQTDAVDWRETISSDRIIPVEPGVQVWDTENSVAVNQPLSPAVIGVAVRRDHEFQGRPFHSWANQPVQGVVGASRPINFSLTDGATEGQTLLAANIGILTRGEMGVSTAIANGGFVSGTFSASRSNSPGIRTPRRNCGSGNSPSTSRRRRPRSFATSVLRAGGIARRSTRSCLTCFRRSADNPGRPLT